MHSHPLSCATFALACLLFGNDLLAHGGQYRGPADVVPPGGRGGQPARPTGPMTGPRAGTPTTPTAPPPAGPRTGRTGPTAQPPGPARGPVRTGGIQLTADLTAWTFWWEFNKHDFIGLRDAVHRSGSTTGYEGFWKGRGTASNTGNLLEPTADQVQNDILPTLKKAIDATEQRDIVSSCLIAMAKIGRDHAEFTLDDVFRPRLARDNQEIRETAALAYGIAAVKQGEGLQTLCDIAFDNDRGRALRGGKVSVRTRSFALYGVGLYAGEHTDAALKRQALTALRAALQDDTLSNRNLKVAAIHGIGLLALDEADAEQAVLRDEAVDALLDYYERRLG
ncbi:MAG: hypothetical protein VYD05_02435, partial [Planctomycetota bacterium]|nr:hypothetical protein [Planctomycetota bacterium]